MKKVLLATTALGLLAASAQAGSGPKLTIGGHVDIQAGHTNQDSAFETGVFTQRDFHTQSDVEVYFSIDGETDSGIGYGGYFELEADVNGDDNTQDDDINNRNAERAYIYIDTMFGRLQAGPHSSASENLKVDASNIARATGGIDGKFHEYINFGAGESYIATPDLPTAGYPGSFGAGAPVGRVNESLATANKITYYTPRYAGLQLGVSYTPDLQERGTSLGFSNGIGASAISIENIWNAGLNYSNEFHGVGVDAAVTAEMGEHESTNRDDLEAINGGFNVSYMGASIGASYAHYTEFGQLKTLNQEGSHWTAGAAYEYGPFGASVTYLNSTIENGAGTNADSEFQNVVVGADYQFAPGFVPYVEVSFFEFDDNEVSSDNDGNVIIFGTTLSF